MLNMMYILTHMNTHLYKIVAVKNILPNIGALLLTWSSTTHLAEAMICFHVNRQTLTSFPCCNTNWNDSSNSLHILSTQIPDYSRCFLFS